jgi:hypothetical protein
VKYDVTGWETFPVRVIGSNDEEVTGYEGLRVTGRSSVITIDKVHSDLVYENRKHGSFPYYKGLYFDVASWDGSDLFAASDMGTAWVLATEKTKVAFERSGAQNIEFTPISDVRLPAVGEPAFPAARVQ